MKIGIQIFVTARKAITIESSDFNNTDACMEELERATARLKLDQVKKDMIRRFGDD